MRWHERDDDYFMLELDPIRAEQQLAMWAVHLSMGNSIYHRTIRLSTIEDYLRAVARKTATHHRHKRDPRKLNPTDGGFGPNVKSVLKELKRWEDVPNRREAFSPDMLDEALKRASFADRDSLDDILADWYACGIYAGLRCGECAQTQTNRRNPDFPTLNFRNETQAFCINDLRARTIKGRRFLKGREILSVPLSDIRCMWLKFRTQKNGKHGVERLFRRTGSTTNPKCFCRAMCRILQRFVRLRGANDTTTPLSVYRDSYGVIRLLTSQDITDHMRSIAAKVFDLDPVKDKDLLQRYSAHSLRVGACVHLHAQGFSAVDIRWILRWESDAYKIYLRNFEGLAKRQTESFDRLDDATAEIAMPALDTYFLQ